MSAVMRVASGGVAMGGSAGGDGGRGDETRAGDDLDKRP